MGNAFRYIKRLSGSDLVQKSVGGQSHVISETEFFTRQPEANAGAKQVLFSGTTATLSGSGTAFDGATIISYLWEVISGGGSITSPSSASTGVTGLTSGRNIFRLTVTDSNGNEARSSVTIFLSATSARWNFTKTAFSVSGNNNMVAGTTVGSLSQGDSATDWVLLTNGGEWEPYLGSFQALNNGEGGSSAGSPTYTTFSANELQGGFLQAGHTTESGGKYPLEFHGLPAGTYKLYLIASIKASVNGNVPNGVYKVKFGSAAATTQTIAQQSNYTTPALVFEGTIADGEIIQFGPYTLTESNGDATCFNCLLIERVLSGTTYNDTLSEAVAAASAEANNATLPSSLSEATTAADSNTTAATFPNTLANGVTTGDGIAAGNTIPSSLSEAVTPGDSLSQIMTIAAALSQAITSGESAVAVMVMPNSLSQAITPDVTQIGGNIFLSDLSEAITIGDAASYLLTLAAQLSEALTPAEALATIMQMGNTLGNAITVGAGQESVNTMLAAVSEGVSVGDSAAGGLLFVCVLSEGITAADALASMHDIVEAISETTALAVVFNGTLDSGTVFAWSGADWVPVKQWDGAEWINVKSYSSLWS